MSSIDDSLALSHIDNDLMTLPEVAKRARVTISTLRAWRLGHLNPCRSSSYLERCWFGDKTSRRSSKQD